MISLPFPNFLSFPLPNKNRVPKWLFISNICVPVSQLITSLSLMPFPCHSGHKAFSFCSPCRNSLSSSTPHQAFAVPQISVLWSHFCVSVSLWANSSLHWSLFFRSSLYPDENSPLFTDNATFSHFLFAIHCPGPRKGIHFDGCLHTMWAIRGAPFIKELYLCYWVQVVFAPNE